MGTVSLKLKSKGTKTITKPAATKVTVARGVFEDQVAKVDRLTEIEAKLATVTARDLIKEYDKITAELRDVANKGLLPEDQATFLGTKLNYVLDPCSNERVVTDLAEVQKRMGSKLFYETAKMPLKELDRYLSKAEAEKVTISKRIGPRKGKLVAK